MAMNVQSPEDFMLPDDVPAHGATPSRDNASGYGGGTFPDISLRRGMPASPDSERSILGAILLDQKHFAEADAGIEESDFSLESHRRIYRRMAELNDGGRSIDLVTLVEELARRKEVESVGGVAYIASLTEGLPRRISIDEYVRIVADKSIGRQIIHQCNKIATRAADQTDHASDLVREMAEQMLEIRNRAKGIWRVKPAKPLLEGGAQFLRSGNPAVQWMVNGIIQRGGNGVIVGEPGAAKSLLVLDMAFHLIAGHSWLGRDILERTRVAVISREDFPGLTKNRAVQFVGGADANLTDKLDEINLDEWLYFNTRAQADTFSLQKEADVSEIIDEIKERQIGFAIFDVFRRLWDGDENDNQEVAKILAVLTRIQTECGCAVALVHHLSKGEGNIFSRIRGASAIYGWREWAIGVSIEDREAEAAKQIRKLQFDTKASATPAPIYFQIDSGMGKIDLIECSAPEEVKRPRAKTRAQGDMF